MFLVIKEYFNVVEKCITFKGATNMKRIKEFQNPNVSFIIKPDLSFTSKEKAIKENSQKIIDKVKDCVDNILLDFVHNTECFSFNILFNGAWYMVCIDLIWGVVDTDFLSNKCNYQDSERLENLIDKKLDL